MIKRAIKASFCTEVIEIESFLITEQDKKVKMIDIYKIDKKEAHARI